MRPDEHDGRPGDPFADLKRSLDVALFVGQVLSLPWTAWTRRFGTWGENYAGFHMLCGVAALFVWAALFPRHDPAALVGFGLATCLLLAVHRVAGVVRRWRGEPAPHSRYTGESRLAFGYGDAWAKTTGEVAAGLAAGGLLVAVSVPLGAYVLCAAVCGGLVNAAEVDAERSRRTRLRDARIDARRYQDLESD